MQPVPGVVRWRFLATPPRDGATNMALDVALMQRARATREAVFRVYGWSRPTLSLGRHQPAAKDYDRAMLEERGIDVVRRPTGGRAILHWREVTYSVTSPATDSVPVKTVYERINAVLISALRKLGVTAHAAAARASRRPDLQPCFAEPSPGEIVAVDSGGAIVGKLVGSAQMREDDALLQHGSILLEDDQLALYELAGSTHAVIAPATLNRVLGRTPCATEVAGALRWALAETVDGSTTCLAPDEVLTMAEGYVERFRDPQWTWRR